MDNKTLAPIDILLFCPNCGLQHVDKAEPDKCEDCGCAIDRHQQGYGTLRAHCIDCSCIGFRAWLNPPHKSHRCHGCNFVWRPADLPTNGVVQILTRGENDASVEELLTPKIRTAMLIINDALRLEFNDGKWIIKTDDPPGVLCNIQQGGIGAPRVHFPDIFAGYIALKKWLNFDNDQSSKTEHIETEHQEGAERRFSKDIDATAREIVECLFAEYEYWKQFDTDAAMGAIGAISNVIAFATVPSHRADWHPKKISCRDTDGGTSADPN